MQKIQKIFSAGLIILAFSSLASKYFTVNSIGCISTTPPATLIIIPTNKFRTNFGDMQTIDITSGSHTVPIREGTSRLYIYANPPMGYSKVVGSKDFTAPWSLLDYPPTELNVMCIP